MKIDERGLIFLRLLVNGIPIDNAASIRKFLLENGYDLVKVK